MKASVTECSIDDELADLKCIESTLLKFGPDPSERPLRSALPDFSFDTKRVEALIIHGIKRSLSKMAKFQSQKSDVRVEHADSILLPLQNTPAMPSQHRKNPI